MRQVYRITIFKRGLVYDRQVHFADEIDITIYILEMLRHGYGLDVKLEEEQ
jgi:hypothetical protein